MGDSMRTDFFVFKGGADGAASTRQLLFLVLQMEHFRLVKVYTRFAPALVAGLGVVAVIDVDKARGRSSGGSFLGEGRAERVPGHGARLETMHCSLCT